MMGFGWEKFTTSSVCHSMAHWKYFIFTWVCAWRNQHRGRRGRAPLILWVVPGLGPPPPEIWKLSLKNTLSIGNIALAVCSTTPIMSRKTTILDRSSPKLTGFLRNNIKKCLSNFKLIDATSLELSCDKHTLKKILYLHPPKHALLNKLLIKQLNRPYYLVDSTKKV